MGSLHWSGKSGWQETSDSTWQQSGVPTNPQERRTIKPLRAGSAGGFRSVSAPAVSEKRNSRQPCSRRSIRFRHDTRAPLQIAISKFDERERRRKFMSNIPSVRLATPNEEVLTSLGLLAELAGTWDGKGFNLIARPDKEGNAPLFLELNQTSETLRFDPIATSIPNRGNSQDDIELFGLTYLQKISDSVTGGALHIEPGIWVNIPQTTAPAEAPSVARMATIPHGNAVLAEGGAISVNPVGSGTALGTFQIKPVNTPPFPQGGNKPAGRNAGWLPRIRPFEHYPGSHEFQNALWQHTCHSASCSD